MTTFKKIEETKDYSLFKKQANNRPVSISKVNELVNSFKQKVLIDPIIVNENFEVIDGQHRLQACIQLNIPVKYLINEGYGVSEMMQLNSSHLNWNERDILNAHYQKGNENYRILKSYCDMYGFSIKLSVYFLCGEWLSLKTGMFVEGGFQVKTPKLAEEFGVNMLKVKPFFKNYKSINFVLAMWRLNKNPLFDFKQFIGKLELQPKSLTVCVSVEKYIELIEEIYNFKSRNKVSLRIF